MTIVEGIANNFNPKYVLFENWELRPDSITYHNEITNTTGFRFLPEGNKHCGIALDISQSVYHKVWQNLGYSVMDSFNIGDDPAISKVVNSSEFKLNGQYTIFKRND